MKTILIIFGIFLLIAGCATTGPSQPAPPPTSSPQLPSNITTMTCEEYCPTLSHMQCVGQWSISGTYPDCICSFECEYEENETVDNEAGPPPPPAEPFPATTNKTISEMLREGMNGQRNEFYRENSGSFRENSYTWIRNPSDVPAGTIGGVASDVKFDGMVIESLEASGFTAFTNTADDTTEAYGLAIFMDRSTLLDDYTAADAFAVDYFPPLIDKELRDCWVYSKEYNTNLEGDWLITYLFRCERVYDK